MKKIILIAIVTTIASFASAQQPYKLWSEFQGDTMSYMYYNFKDNGQRYVGQPLSVLLTDYELPLGTVLISTNAKGNEFFQDGYINNAN
jgi:hypothetical protein